MERLKRLARAWREVGVVLVDWATLIGLGLGEVLREELDEVLGDASLDQPNDPPPAKH